jgi:hypothetical protein
VITDPIPFEKGSQAAIAALRCALEDEIKAFEAIRAAPQGEIGDRVEQAIKGLRDYCEEMFRTIKMQSLATMALMHEVAADRRVIFAMMSALLRESEFDRERLHADFLEKAAKLFGGPDSFPEQARQAAAILLGRDFD